MTGHKFPNSNSENLKNVKVTFWPNVTIYQTKAYNELLNITHIYFFMNFELSENVLLTWMWI